MGKELLGAQGLVAYLFDALEVLGQLAFVFTKIDLYLFDKFVEEHLHNCEVIFELFHYLVPDIIVDEKFVLIFSKGLAINFAFLEPDVALVGDHALPLRQHKDKDLSLMQRDVEFVHGEAVVDFEGKVVQEDGFVPFEQEPVFDLANGLLFALGLLVLLSD